MCSFKKTANDIFLTWMEKPYKNLNIEQPCIHVSIMILNHPKKRAQKYVIYLNLWDTNTKKSALTINDSNRDEKISKSFWSYCKNTFEKDDFYIKQVAKVILKILTTKQCKINLWFFKLNEATSWTNSHLWSSLPMYQRSPELSTKPSLVVHHAHMTIWV